MPSTFHSKIIFASKIFFSKNELITQLCNVVDIFLAGKSGTLEMKRAGPNQHLRVIRPGPALISRPERTDEMFAVSQSDGRALVSRDVLKIAASAGAVASDSACL